MPLDYNQAAVRYAAKTKLMELALETAETRSLRKVQDEINQGFKIFLRLQALDYGDYLSKDERDQICYCLMELADITDLPVAPVLGSIEPPSVLVGIRGATGDTGAEGPEGGGVPFTYENITQDTIVDSFAITESRGVEYQLNIYGDDGMRVMRLIGGWSEDGLDYGDDGGDGTDDIYGDTSAVSMSIVVSGSTVQLFATVTPGSTWTISGTRKYIPNNGNGIVTPTTLTDGKVWVGNSSNSPTAVTLSGDVTITNAGVSSITAGSIVNADLSASAAVAFSKMASLTASRAVVTDGSGVITTAAPTATQVGYLSNVSSDIQAQLDSKLGTATGAISTVTSTNLTPSYAVISNPAGKIAVSSVNTTELGFVQGVTSPIQAQINSRVADTGDTMTGALVNTSTIEAQGGIRTQSSGSYYKLLTLSIGDWDMDSTANVDINHGLTAANIRGWSVNILDDSSQGHLFAGADVDNVNTFYDATKFRLTRQIGGIFDSTNYNATSFNRGFINILYVA